MVKNDCHLLGHGVSQKFAVSQEWIDKTSRLFAYIQI